MKFAPGPLHPSLLLARFETVWPHLDQAPDPYRARCLLHFTVKCSMLPASPYKVTTPRPCLWCDTRLTPLSCLDIPVECIHLGRNHHVYLPQAHCHSIMPAPAVPERASLLTSFTTQAFTCQLRSVLNIIACVLFVICACVHTCIIHIYIYREREREMIKCSVALSRRAVKIELRRRRGWSIRRIEPWRVGILAGCDISLSLSLYIYIYIYIYTQYIYIYTYIYIYIYTYIHTYIHTCDEEMEPRFEE